MIKTVIKILFLIIIVMVIAYVWLTFSASSACSKKTEMPVELLPPYHVAITQSLSYASKDIQDQGDLVIVYFPFYTLVKGKWEPDKTGQDLELRESIYGPIRVIKVQN